MRTRALRQVAQVCALASMLAAAPAAGQGVIDFETIPGDVPVEGLAISDQFLASHGVTFSLEGGGSPVLAEVGPPMTAFQGPGGGSDNPAAGVDIGSFLLTDDGVVAPGPPPLIVSYAAPTAAVSGVILDVDATESFVIEARDEFDAVLESLTISAGDPGTGDGIASWWSFQRGQEDIYSIRLVGSADPGAAFGLGFDNFNASGLCPGIPAGGCLTAAKASLSIAEKKAGSEKLKATLKGFDMQTVQQDFGDPVGAATRYDVCIYDDMDQLVASLTEDRAGDLCGPKQKPCWKAKKDTGWTYKDPVAASDGVKKVAAASGAVGKGKLQVQAGNKAKKGQVAMPTGVTALLQGAASARVQVATSDAACFEAMLGDVKKADGVQFKAKTAKGP